MKDWSIRNHMEVPFTVFINLCRAEETFCNNLYLCENNLYLCEANKRTFPFYPDKYYFPCSIAERVMVRINLTSSPLCILLLPLQRAFLFRYMLLASVLKDRSSKGVNCNRMANCDQSTSFPGYNGWALFFWLKSNLIITSIFFFFTPIVLYENFTKPNRGNYELLLHC